MLQIFSISESIIINDSGKEKAFSMRTNAGEVPISETTFEHLTRLFSTPPEEREIRRLKSKLESTQVLQNWTADEKFEIKIPDAVLSKVGFYRDSTVQETTLTTSPPCEDEADFDDGVSQG